MARHLRPDLVPRLVGVGALGERATSTLRCVTGPIRVSDDDGVRVLTLARADEYNTINPALRDALANALDAADRDDNVRAVLLRAEGPAFCAGYQLDWATTGQAETEAASTRVWDSAADV